MAPLEVVEGRSESESESEQIAAAEEVTASSSAVGCVGGEDSDSEADPDYLLVERPSVAEGAGEGDGQADQAIPTMSKNFRVI